jgi:hypothetical protein
MGRRSYLEEIWEVRCTHKQLSPGTVDLAICHDNSEHVLSRIGIRARVPTLYEAWGKYLLKGLGILAHLKKPRSNTRHRLS